MRRLMLLIAVSGLGVVASAQAQAQEKPCMADAARLCADVEPGGGAQMQCLKAHKQELSPACKKKVMQTKIKQMERDELQQQQQQQPPPSP